MGAVLKIDIIADASKAVAGVAKTEQATRKIGAGFAKIATGIAGALAVGGVIAYAKGAIGAASDVAESASKVGVVFGKQAGQVLAASKTSATAMGLSRAAYLDANGTLGNLLVSLQIAPKKAADMSQQMVKLAGDMASFNNVSPEDALAAIQSGLTGETEPLKKFGVNMNDATLRAQALKLGLIKTTKDAMTPQTKALAAQALIMAQTTTAQGDFARTSGGLANQQRILSAQFADVKAKVGAALLPVMITLVHFLNRSLIPMFAFVAGGVRAMVAAFKAGGSDVTSSGFAGVMERIGLIARRVVNAIVAAWPRIQAVIVAAWTSYIRPALLALAAFITDRLLPAIRAIIAFIVAHWPQIQAAFAAAWAAIQPVIAAWANAVLTLWHQVIEPLVGWIKAHWSQIQIAIEVVFVAIAILFKVFTVALTIFYRAVAVIITVLATVFRGLYTVVAFIFKAIALYITTYVAVIKAVIGGLSAAVARIGGFFSAAYTAVASAVGKVVDVVKGLPGKIGEAAGAMFTAGADLMGALFHGLASAAGKIGDIGKAIANSVIDGLNAVIPNTIKLHIPIPKAPDINISIPFLPDIPHLAAGAYATRATLGVFGEAGPEYVLPEKMLRAELARAAGGNTYRINVTVAPTANPADAGRSVVDAIRAFESAAGNGWRTA